jgi:hypothetical protein
MDEGPKNGMGEGRKAESNAVDHHLPVVWSPKLDADEGAPAAEASDQWGDFTSGEPTSPPEDDAVEQAPPAAPPQPRSSRFPLLAATIALAAGFGSFAGVLAASGVMQLAPGHAPNSHAADVSSVLQAMKAQVAALSVIKSSLDGANRNANAEFAKIADRLDRVERAEADPATKLAQIADAVDRLEKHGATAADITGSVPQGASATSVAKETDRILPDWIVQDVRRGRAMVENAYGRVFFVGPGSILPRLGSVQDVKRKDGSWLVVTEHGTITSTPH